MRFSAKRWVELEVAMMVDAYDSDIPGSADVLRDSILEGNYDDELTDRRCRAVLAILDSLRKAKI